LSSFVDILATAFAFIGTAVCRMLLW